MSSTTAVRPTRELSGTLHPHATDGPTRWRIDLGAVSPAVPAHAQAVWLFAAPL
ncbi:MAG: hypothetical protein WA895_01495 [Streptosporangiaceae bacterium]